jgi:hypothetical protein
MADFPDWHGHIPDDDVAKFSGFAAEINAFQSFFAPKNGGCPVRAFHVKAHAGLRAELHVSTDIPVVARHGVFASPRIWPALVRVSNGYSTTMWDWFPDLVGFAVKLQDMDEPTLLPGDNAPPTQDFLALNRRYLPVNDAGDLMVISMATKNFITAPFMLLKGLGLVHGTQVIFWTLGWSIKRLFLRSAVTSDFFGIAPICLGETPVKFRWSPQKRTPSSWFGGFKSFLRRDLKQRLTEGELRFDLSVQFYIDNQTTPIDGGWPWPEHLAPWVSIAELIIAPADLESAEALVATSTANALAYNPWNAIAAHRPIGNIQRARGLIYQRSAIFRSKDQA